MGVELIDKEQFKQCLPLTLRKGVSQKLMDQINTTISDPVILEAFKDNLVGYASVLAQGKFKMASYICAVKFISYRAMGVGITDAYLNTFPGKQADFAARNVPAKTISSYASAYGKTKLVGLLLEQVMIPVHIINAPLFQKALNVQAKIMLDADASFKVRSDAADSLLAHLKPPENRKIELDIGIHKSDAIAGLMESTNKLIKQQEEMLQRGNLNAKQVAELELVHSTEEAVS